MDSHLNTTMRLEGMDVINTTFQWINGLKLNVSDYPPTYLNVNKNEYYYLYLIILLMKNAIFLHGIIQTLPKWIPLVCFPALLVYNHNSVISGGPIAYMFTTPSSGFIWIMIWQSVLNVPRKYTFFAVGLAMAELVLDFYQYSGFQITVDMIIVLIKTWHVISLFMKKRYLTICILTCLLVCGMSVVFYVFIMIMSILVICSRHQGLYEVIFENKEDEELFNIVVLGTKFVMMWEFFAWIYKKW